MNVAVIPVFVRIFNLYDYLDVGVMLFFSPYKSERSLNQLLIAQYPPEYQIPSVVALDLSNIDKQ